MSTETFEKAQVPPVTENGYCFQRYGDLARDILKAGFYVIHSADGGGDPLHQGSGQEVQHELETSTVALKLRKCT
jgi:hypothetical protein